MVGYVALGSNLGDREANLRNGLAGMADLGLEVEAVSSIWETEPVDAPEPLWFLNMVARLRTRRSPIEVLDILLEVERRAGRLRTVPNAPRELDLDLLMMGDLRYEGPRLELPHPRMWQRRFVLAPLGELAPNLRNPVTNRTVSETCRSLGSRPAVRKIGVLAAPVVGRI